MAPPAVPLVLAHLIVAAWVKLGDRRQQRHQANQADPSPQERQAGKQDEGRAST